MSRMNQNPSQKKKKSKPRPQKSGAGYGGTMRVASHPPMFYAQEVRHIHVRTLASGALVNQAFTIAQLAGLVGVVANTATTCRNLSQVYKLNKVLVWGPVATAGTPVSVKLVWNNSANDFAGPPVQILDTAVSFDWPAYINCAPPRGSLSSKWHDSTETDLTFTLSCPVGSTVDFDFEWVLSDLNVQNSATVIAGASVGEIYHLTTNTLVPQGVNTV